MLKNYKSIFEDRASDKFTGGFHETPYDQIMKYVNVPNTFISFRSIDKIGINPKSKYNTPNGIYCYPLKEISKGFDKGTKEIIVPFAGSAPFCYVIQIKNGIRGIKLSEYSNSKFESDVKILQRKYNILTNEKIKEYVSQSFFKTPGGMIWGIAYFLAKELNPNKFPNTWNFIFSKDLDYGYIWDDKGKGIIHRNEPLQCVFFNTKSFKVLDDVIMNRKTLNKNFMEVPKWLLDSGNKLDNIRMENGKVVWENGIWSGIWEDGIFENGTFKDGFWKTGTWKNGDWIQGNIWSDKFKKHVFSKINPNDFYKIEERSPNLDYLKKYANMQT